MPPGPDDDPRASGESEGDPEPVIDEPVVDELVESAEPIGDGEEHTALPPKVESWRRRSATGAILTGFALGLQQVFETKKDEPAIVMETSGDPPRDLPVEAQVEQGRPRQSIVQIRPWLLASAAGATDPAKPGDSGPSNAGPSDPGPSDPGPSGSSAAPGADRGDSGDRPASSDAS